VNFRAERKRLRHLLRPGEEILASDHLCAVEERPELTVVSHPLLVVTDRSVYLILSGQQPEMGRIDLDALVEVTRTEDPVPGSTLRLAANDGAVLTLTYEPRTRRHDTADLITKHFFGRVIKDTAVVDPP
jgi:hypothetical protein